MIVPTIPGIYHNLTMAEYLAIPAISAGIVKTIVDRCPAAAWYESHLNPDRPQENTAASDAGSIAHAILLEGSEACCEVIDLTSYMTKNNTPAKTWTDESRAKRDAIRAEGRIPVVPDDLTEVREMVKAAKRYIDSLRESEPAIWAAFQPDGGESEVTLVWDDKGLLCKMRIDRVAGEYDLMIDYKTSGDSVEPGYFSRRTMANMGHYISAAWYRRGLLELTGKDAPYIFLAQEQARPYLCSLIGNEPAALDLGDAKIRFATKLWRECVAGGQFPGYPTRVCYSDLPAWVAQDFETKELINYGSQA